MGSEEVVEEAKDYLKIFHSILNNEWTSEKSSEDDLLLSNHCEQIVGKVLQCITRSFDSPHKVPKCSGL